MAVMNNINRLKKVSTTIAGAIHSNTITNAIYLNNINNYYEDFYRHKEQVYQNFVHDIARRLLRIKPVRLYLNLLEIIMRI